jgi:hypothetical protein
MIQERKKLMFYLIEIKNFCEKLCQEKEKEKKRLEKPFPKHISDKGLVSKNIQRTLKTQQ